MKSSNFNGRAAGIALDYIVLHYTGMNNAESALQRMCDPAAEVSAHYMIDEDGGVVPLVDESRRAWHAGKSYWRGITDLNSASIGIELVNPGHEHGYRPFPHIQLDALKKLLPVIIARHHLDARRCLLAHSDIAFRRRADPGEFFPWREFANSGFGLWPAENDASPLNEEQIKDLLAAIGYDVSEPRLALMAFQRRFEPENITSLAFARTWARLRSIAQQMG